LALAGFSGQAFAAPTLDIRQVNISAEVLSDGSTKVIEKRTIFYNNNSMYPGGFKDDLFGGEGTYIDPNRRKTTGRWENDQYVSR